MSTYMTSAMVDDDILLGKLDAMVTANAPTRSIANVMSKELGKMLHCTFPQSAVADRVACNGSAGMHMTTKQIKNLIAGRMGKQSSEERLRKLLNTYINCGDNHCVLIHDQLELTCAIVMQTSAQREIFTRYGECLLMDFTHNTNNLGYYLGKNLSSNFTVLLQPYVLNMVFNVHTGSLVATSPTGRGIPVVDFLCLNQRKETMKAVLDYFKTMNPLWTSIETFVIDKDFVEWSVLVELFPEAEVSPVLLEIFSFVMSVC